MTTQSSLRTASFLLMLALVGNAFAVLCAFAERFSAPALAEVLDEQVSNTPPAERRLAIFRELERSTRRMIAFQSSGIVIAAILTLIALSMMRNPAPDSSDSPR